jgi:ribose transport system substrate-binding protein
MSKLALLFFVALSVSLFFASCSSGKKTISIAVIPKGTTHVFWQAVKAGAEKAAAESTGPKVTIFWNGPAREGDRDGQIQVVEDFLTRRVNGIVLAPLDENALVPVLERVDAAKIPCVIIDSSVKSKKILSFIATDNFQGGAMAAKKMIELLGGKGRVLMLDYMAGSSSTMERARGFSETLAQEGKGITLVDKKYGQDTVETALQAAEDLLTKNKNIDGVFAVNESTVVAALRALEGRGLAGKIKLVGFDASTPLIAGLSAGKVSALVVQNPFKMGYEGVKAVLAKIDGKEVAPRLDTGVVLVTLDNLKSTEIQELLNPGKK